MAIAGYAQSPVERHAGRSLGALTVETARRADRRRRVDGRPGGRVRHGQPLSRPRAPTRPRTASSLVSANWLAEHLGVNPRYAAGFQGIGPDPGRGGHGGQRRGQRRGRLRARAPGAAQSPGQLPRQPHDRSAGRSAVDRAAGVLRSAGHDRPGLQRVPPALRRRARGHGRGRRRGPQERGPDPVVLLVRQAAVGRGLPGRADDQRPHLPLRLRHPGRRRRRLRLHLGRAGQGPPPSARSTSRATPAGSPVRRRLPLHWPLDDIMEVGAETARRLWEATGVGPDDVDLPQVYDGFSPFVYFWMESLGLCPVGEAHRFVRDGGIDSDRPERCRSSPVAARWGTAACTASRRCSSATCSSRGGRASANAPTRRSGSPATRRRTSEGPWSTAPSRNEIDMG